MGPSDSNIGPNDPILYIIIVSCLFYPFSAILDFFDFYHAIATLSKLKNLENLAFLAIFLSKMVEIAHFGVHFLGQENALNRAIFAGISSFWLFCELYSSCGKF